MPATSSPDAKLVTQQKARTVIAFDLDQRDATHRDACLENRFEPGHDLAAFGVQ